jgi:hypothetical protein
MSTRRLGLLFVLGLLVAGLAAVWVGAPGYMDADYYFASGKQIASGQGLWAPFIWNYLDDPAGLPHPTHTYWMPLGALVSAAGMLLRGALTFRAAQLPFVLLAAMIPPVTAALSYAITRSPRQGWMAGLLAVLPGFYLPLLVTTETFGLYMLLGSAFLALAAPSDRLRVGLRGILLGLVAGGMHICRADGLLWLAVALGLASWEAVLSIRKGQPGSLRLPFAVLAGYLAVTLLWYGRNLNLFESLMPPGGSRALWITAYDQTFSYPASGLTLQHWLAGGIGPLMQARWEALSMNLKTLLGVQGLVLLLPLSLAGMWRYRTDSRVQLGAGLWLVTFLVMTLVFPFAGSRGGFLHSGAAAQPLLWALAPAGLERLVEWGQRARGWRKGQALRVFSAGLLALVGVLTAGLYLQRVIGTNPAQPAWAAGERTYQAVGQALEERGVPLDAVVLVNNPPGFFAATGRPAIVIPDGPLDRSLQAAQDFGARYLLLEPDQANLMDLVQDPSDRPGLTYLKTVAGVHLFEVTP